MQCNANEDNRLPTSSQINKSSRTYIHYKERAKQSKHQADVTLPVSNARRVERTTQLELGKQTRIRTIKHNVEEWIIWFGARLDKEGTTQQLTEEKEALEDGSLGGSKLVKR